MEIDYDYLRTGTAIGFRASHELCSNYFFIQAADKWLSDEVLIPTTDSDFDAYFIRPRLFLKKSLNSF